MSLATSMIVMGYVLVLTFFLYLQPRSSMKACGVPWNTPRTTREMHKIVAKHEQAKNLVSKIYSLLC